uniref:Bee-milk protein n=1 Tax=Glossina pallidipes TaxID=7398 RepID=A0A1B0A692_GLOPL
MSNDNRRSHYFLLRSSKTQKCKKRYNRVLTEFESTTTTVIILLTALIVFNTSSASWLLTRCGLNEPYRVLHLSTNNNHVYLSIETKSKIFPTLIETEWPTTCVRFPIPKVFPHRSFHNTNHHRNCRLIQQARWSQMDNFQRLWVMDFDWSAKQNNCLPKLLAFDFMRQGMEVLRIDCHKFMKIKPEQLLDIKLGPAMGKRGMEQFIYFILAIDTHLVAYDIFEQKWFRYPLLSKKYKDVAVSLPVKPRNVAFSHQKEILIADEDGKLYISNSSEIVNAGLQLKLLGSLLGSVESLLVDRNDMFYAIPAFGAVVRCPRKHNITAEDNEIIYLTTRNIKQIFFRTKGSLYFLIDRWQED